MQRGRLLYGLTLLAACTTASTRAGTYDEAIHGDLSGVAASPTPWALTLGANTLVGSAGLVGTTDDFDLVTFTVPAGTQLDSIITTAFANQFGQTFFALQAGSPWNDLLGYDMSGNNLMGWTLITNSNTNVNLLPRLQENGDPNTFPIPLPAGVYTFENQDVNTSYTYNLTFNVSQVPEPAAAALAGLALGGFNAARRRRGGGTPKVLRRAW
jgi:hypothetical protein